jgi:hypothetical protein
VNHLNWKWNGKGEGEKGRWKKSDGNVMWDGLWDGRSWKTKP